MCVVYTVYTLYYYDTVKFFRCIFWAFCSRLTATLQSAHVRTLHTQYALMSEDHVPQLFLPSSILQFVSANLELGLEGAQKVLKNCMD